VQRSAGGARRKRVFALAKNHGVAFCGAGRRALALVEGGVFVTGGCA
jgi:hypothetical protein